MPRTIVSGTSLYFLTKSIITMKNPLFALMLLTWASFSLQAQTDYKQWETHRFFAKRGHEADFEKGLAEHNKKFHNAVELIRIYAMRPRELNPFLHYDGDTQPSALTSATVLKV